MPMNTTQELLKHDLGDLLYAEKQVLKALGPMIREASDDQLKQRLEQHREETEQHVSNVEQAFQAMGLKPKAQKCPGILGIIEEKKEFKSDEEPTPQLLEAFNLGAGLRVENYEIAAYRSAIALAKSLGQREVADLLKANLDQELAMARFIESSASRVLRAAQGAERDAGDDEDGGPARKRSGGRSTGKRAGRSAGARKSGAGGGSRGASKGGRGTSQPDVAATGA